MRTFPVSLLTTYHRNSEKLWYATCKWGSIGLGLGKYMQTTFKVLTSKRGEKFRGWSRFSGKNLARYVEYDTYHRWSPEAISSVKTPNEISYVANESSLMRLIMSCGMCFLIRGTGGAVKKTLARRYYYWHYYRQDRRSVVPLRAALSYSWNFKSTDISVDIILEKIIIVFISVRFMNMYIHCRLLNEPRPRQDMARLDNHNFSSNH